MRKSVNEKERGSREIGYFCFCISFLFLLQWLIDRLLFRRQRTRQTIQTGAPYAWSNYVSQSNRPENCTDPEGVYVCECKSTLTSMERARRKKESLLSGCAKADASGGGEGSLVLGRPISAAY